MFFIIFESALKNVKYLKQRCSALMISVTSTREMLSHILAFVSIVKVDILNKTVGCFPPFNFVKDAFE